MKDIFAKSTDFGAKIVKVAEIVGGWDTLASRSGISKKELFEYRIGKAGPDLDKVIALSNASGLPGKWFAYGELPVEKQFDFAAEACEEIIEAIFAYPLGGTCDEDYDIPSEGYQAIDEAVQRLCIKLAKEGGVLNR